MGREVWLPRAARAHSGLVESIVVANDGKRLSPQRLACKQRGELADGAEDFGAWAVVRLALRNREKRVRLDARCIHSLVWEPMIELRQREQDLVRWASLLNERSDDAVDEMHAPRDGGERHIE